MEELNKLYKATSVINFINILIKRKPSLKTFNKYYNYLNNLNLDLNNFLNIILNKFNNIINEIPVIINNKSEYEEEFNNVLNNIYNLSFDINTFILNLKFKKFDNNNDVNLNNKNYNIINKLHESVFGLDGTLNKLKKLQRYLVSYYFYIKNYISESETNVPIYNSILYGKELFESELQNVSYKKRLKLTYNFFKNFNNLILY